MDKTIYGQVDEILRLGEGLVESIFMVKGTQVLTLGFSNDVYYSTVSAETRDKIARAVKVGGYSRTHYLEAFPKKYIKIYHAGSKLGTVSKFAWE